MKKMELTTQLTVKQGELLILLARKTITEKFGKKVTEKQYEEFDDHFADEVFKEGSGVFVTIKKNGHLRGCIGNLASGDSIVAGVATHAINAAFHDPRFSPLKFDELAEISIEVSVLSKPLELVYHGTDDLLKKIRVGIDGLILKKGYSSATFLPQVWEQLRTPDLFLSHLCLKAGLRADEWQHSKLEIFTYQVQYFEEKKGKISR